MTQQTLVPWPVWLTKVESILGRELTNLSDPMEAWWGGSTPEDYVNSTEPIIHRTYLPAGERYTSYEVVHDGTMTVLLNTTLKQARDTAAKLNADYVLAVY